MTRIYQGTLDASVAKSVTMFDFGSGYCKWAEGKVHAKDKNLKPKKTKSLSITTGQREYVIDRDAAGNHQLSFLPKRSIVQNKKSLTSRAVVREPTQCSGDCNDSPKVCPVGEVPVCDNDYLICIPAPGVPLQAVSPKRKAPKKKAAKNSASKKKASKMAGSKKTKAATRTRVMRRRK